MPLDLEREPHVLDLGLRLGEVRDVAKRCWFGFCCSGHGAWIRWSGREGKGVLRSRAPDAAQRFFSGALQSRGPLGRRSGSRLALRASGTRNQAVAALSSRSAAALASAV